jgi:hypothetical protein
MRVQTLAAAAVSRNSAIQFISGKPSRSLSKLGLCRCLYLIMPLGPRHVGRQGKFHCSLDRDTLAQRSPEGGDARRELIAGLGAMAVRSPHTLDSTVGFLNAGTPSGYGRFAAAFRQALNARGSAIPGGATRGYRA